MLLVFIPALPFVGFLLNVAFGRRLTKVQSAWVAVGAMAGSFAVSVVAAARLIGQPAGSREIVAKTFSWIRSGDFVVDATLRLDPLSALMILIVSGIGLLIHVYSIAYMHDERDGEFARYFSYLNLFAAFMLVLVLAAGFVLMFVGWEGVGLASYLLIGFWYARKTATDAGKKAFVVNRVGDAAFVLGVLLLFVRFGTVEFQTVAQAVSALPTEEHFGPLSLAALLLFVGATGKSAQIPLYVWLPDAMEGPTPVSALIHAATMVTAGVYLIGRNAVLFGHAPLILAVIAVIGVVTALGAATIGLVQTDIKRVLAYSTISQLGFMFLAMGVGAYSAGIFHLYTHAFFKALLFLGAGSVIHALSGEQDLRRMGGLRRELPLTYWTFLVGALAIAGVPGLAGFFSKDEILFRTYSTGHLLLWAVGLLTSLLTAVYMFRLVFLAFHGARRRPAAHAEHPPVGSVDTLASIPLSSHLHDAPPAMAVALVALALGSVLAGYLGVPHALGGSNRVESFLEPSFAPIASTASHASEAASDEPGELSLMAVSTGVALGGIGLAVLLFLANPRAAEQIDARMGPLRTLLMNKYYVDEIYDRLIVQPVSRLAERGLWKGIDVGLIDGAIDGLGASVARLGGAARRVQSGSVRVYAASFLVGVVFAIGYYWLR